MKLENFELERTKLEFLSEWRRSLQPFNGKIHESSKLQLWMDETEMTFSNTTEITRCEIVWKGVAAQEWKCKKIDFTKDGFHNFSSSQPVKTQFAHTFHDETSHFMTKPALTPQFRIPSLETCFNSRSLNSRNSQKKSS